MSIINVETLIVQTMGFAVALAWGGAIDKFTRSIYVPDELKDHPDYKNVNALAKSGLAYAIVTTLIIIAIVFIVNNILYVTYEIDPPTTPNSIGHHHTVNRGTLSSSGRGIDIVMSKH